MVYTIGPAPYYVTYLDGSPISWGGTDYWVDKPYLGGVSGIESWVTSHQVNFEWNPTKSTWDAFQLANPNEPPYGEMTPISGCFIATACYGTSTHKDLDTLRRFRDERLPYELVDLYYRYSPSVAKVIAQSRTLRWIVRQPIRVFVWILSHS